MERKIGETFEFEGKKLQVKETSGYTCNGCFFKDRCTSTTEDIVGFCVPGLRKDDKEIIIVEVQQPQELNLCEILKDCPKGEEFWSPMLGEVKLHNIDYEEQKIYVILKTGALWYINADGTLTVGGVISSEIMLYPSRTQRSWTDVKYEKKKERFNPKTLNPFDKVLVFDSDRPWTPLMFSYLEYTLNYPRMQCFDFVARKVIPYNKETEHLLGTHNEAPDFYRYWED